MNLGQPPFSKSRQLNNDLDALGFEIATNTTIPLKLHLPGHPRIDLDDSTKLTEFLDREFCSPILEAMAPYLWVMSTQSSANVNPLHRQRVKGREIIITEDPRLHLVWVSETGARTMAYRLTTG